MTILKPFKAIRPRKEFAAKVAALPYDVMSSKEARVMAQGNPYSFLHVDKAEIDLAPMVNIYDDIVYETAAKNLQKMIADKIYFQDSTAYYYIYQQRMGDRVQAGIVGCASIDDYLENRIKKHEYTRPEKEEDRIRHVKACNANTGPIFQTFRDSQNVSQLIKDWQQNHQPIYDFISDDQVQHSVWVIDDQKIIKDLQEKISRVGDFYIADGHHRAASAVKVGLQKRRENPDYTGEEEFNFFLSVLFPSDQLSIWDYNRYAKDLGQHTKELFLARVARSFEIDPSDSSKPTKPHTFKMYVYDKWFLLTAKPEIIKNSLIDDLDVSILQEHILKPILNIKDPRTSDRIEFVGGIRGTEELEKLVKKEHKGVAFALYPTSIDDLMAIADNNQVMPPKSTWFEPKLRSGLFIHPLD